MLFCTINLISKFIYILEEKEKTLEKRFFFKNILPELMT